MYYDQHWDDEKILGAKLVTISDLPVKIFWNAASTFVESKAEVSGNDNRFFFLQERSKPGMYTGHERGADFRRQASAAKYLGRDIHNVGMKPFSTSLQ